MLASLGVIVAVTVVEPGMPPVTETVLPLPETVTIEVLPDSHTIV